MKLFGYEISITKIINNTKQVLPIITEAKYIGNTLTIEYSNGDIVKYNGECTVWRKLPMMERCSTVKEGELCRIWKYIKTHGNPYPTAHLSENDKCPICFAEEVPVNSPRTVYACGSSSYDGREETLIKKCGD